MDTDLIYQLALTMVPQVGPVQAKILSEHFDTAGDIFKSPVSLLKRIEGIGEIRATQIRQFRDFDKAEKEVLFLHSNNISTLFLKDPAYPKRLLNCYDPPTLLFMKGRTELNKSKMISIVGSRHHTEYGKTLVENLVNSLAQLEVVIISGLAYGIDALAHKAALKNNLVTIGVLAHGLDQVYPYRHIPIAKEMIEKGGALISEFRGGTLPDRHNFPSRNRIVAGITDATIVIETGVKGGSMITAELANNYNRDVFAYPGRLTDMQSGGCNSLISQNKAVLVTDPTDIAAALGWESHNKKNEVQKKLFFDLSEEEQRVFDLLKRKNKVQLDEISTQTGLPLSTIATTMLNLELQNLILSLPGKMYQLA